MALKYVQSKAGPTAVGTGHTDGGLFFCFFLMMYLNVMVLGIFIEMDVCWVTVCRQIG